MDKIELKELKIVIDTETFDPLNRIFSWEYCRNCGKLLSESDKVHYVIASPNNRDNSLCWVCEARLKGEII